VNKAVLSNRIYLKRTKEIHDSLITELTYKLPAKQHGMPPEFHCDVTRINDNVITIPIGRQDLIPEGYEIEEKRSIVPVTFPKFKFELRESQAEVVDDLEDSCIVNANPAWGKTFTGIAMACKLGQKTLVVVHTAALRAQWIKEVEKTLGIKAGEIGGGKNSTNSIIVIATMQSLKSRMTEVRDSYGTIILDECHHLPATVFKGIIDACRARYKIGLSATLWRKDGKHVFLQDYTGMKIYKPEDENRVRSKIIIVNTEIKFSSDPNKPWAIRVNELMQNEEYIDLVVKLSRAQADLGHKVLTVADRVEFLETIEDKLEDSFKLITGNTLDRSFDPDLYDGIAGSSKIFSEGFNEPILSSLIMAMVINNRALLKQLLGRIERQHPDKKQPVAIDIALKGRTARAQAAQRINFYSNEGYEIKYI